MTDYSNVPDHEINARVGEELGMTAHFIEHDGRVKFRDTSGRIQGTKDYCNNPADAWPIIVNHGISLTHDYGEWESEACLDLPVGAHGTDELCSVGGIDKNPLRAAMIAFLLLKESEKCSS
ncbi:phage protein NinX family protein [Serratia quinivorans]|uniref:phage protein NinX family protein n=1 Tax=Serratia quinivorans TaxID=137545 RepID=UPI003F94A65E